MAPFSLSKLRSLHQTQGDSKCTNVNDKTTTSWGACGTHNVSSTNNTSLSLTVSHGWASTTFKYVRVRTDKDGRYSDWVIGKTQYGS